MTSDPAQGQLADASTLPTRVTGDRAEWEALGFHFGKQDPADPIFTHTLLPLGWSRDRGTGQVWKVLRDEQQRARAHVFYEPAPHHRDAHMKLLDVAEYVAWALEHGEPVVTDEEWATRQAVKDVADAATRRLLEEMRAKPDDIGGIKAVVATMGDFERYNTLAARMRAPEPHGAPQDDPPGRFLACPATDCDYEVPVSSQDQDASLGVLYDHIHHSHAAHSHDATQAWLAEVKEVTR